MIFRSAVKPWVLAGLIAGLAAPAARADDWKFGPGIGFTKGDFQMNLKGYVQEDLRSFRNFGLSEDDQAALLNPTNELRRSRIGIEGEYKMLSWEFEMDPKSRELPFNPLSTDPQKQEEYMKNAYAEVKFSKAFRIRAGNFKLPISPELLISEAKVDFIERSMLASRMGPNRDWGVMVYGEVNKKLLYQVGVFAGDGRVDLERAGTTFASRAVLTPIEGLDVGGSFTLGTVTAAVQAPGSIVIPKGMSFEGKGPSGWKYTGKRFVQGHRTRIDFEGSYTRGPWAVKSEFMRGQEQRLGQGPVCTQSGATLVCDDLPDQVGDGWAVSTTWLVTGEKKGKSVKPNHPMFHGAGAVELGLRYEGLNFDDNAPNTGFEGVGLRARNIRPGADHVFTGGISWWPHELVRILGNVTVERFSDPLLAPTTGKAGDYVTLIARLQFSLP